MNEELTLGQYEKIDPEFKAEFVAALRSGKYTQGRGFLRLRWSVEADKPDELCCLGVGCDLIEPEAWDEGSRPNWGFVEARQTSDFPWISNKASKRLSDLNDLELWDFNQIADWIEEYL